MCRCSRFVLSAICAVIFVVHTQFVRADADAKVHFDLPAETMDKALRELAIQAHSNISYEPAIVADLGAPEIKGDFTVTDALRMILAGTRLIAVGIDANTIHIQKEAPSSSLKSASGRGVHLAAGGVAPAGQDVQVLQGNPASQSSDSDANGRKDRDIQEITVTGTHIRGTTDSPSPVEIYTRADIDATGMATVQQFLESLPQNFNGGASENTIGQTTGGGQANNGVSGSAPNLRGLGASATLVLINGHRVAPGNNDGGFVDVSMIPLTAVERIEIVTDGGSAIYGSDAVGGVVNFILRSKFDGAESRVQYGSVTKGSRHDVQFGQTVGDEWANGSSVISYQYYDQTPLSAASRDYLHSVPLPYDLLPSQVQHAVFANLNQEIAPNFGLHGDFIYSHRSTNITTTDGDSMYGYTAESTPSKIDGYSATVGSTLSLAHKSTLDISATYSETDTTQSLFETPAAPSLQYFEKTKAAIISVDANLDGILASMPAGAVRYAIGGQYRSESFGDTYYVPVTDNTFYPSRRVEAGYGEMRVPILGGSVGGDPSLELTLADRGEHYSDFGKTNNPQVGVIWKAVAGVAARATYGTSFKAPILSYLDPTPSEVVPIPGNEFNPAPGGTPNTLTVYGGNPNLKPEKARVWTTGLDFTPPQIPGISARLTYYDIVFKDQINAASGSICGCDAFVDAAMLGPEIVNRNPSPALIQQLISEPTYINFFNLNPASIQAIYDSRYMNLSTVVTRGLDFKFSDKLSALGNQIEAGLDGTYIFSFDQQFTNAAPVVALRNTVWNPNNLRMRARLTLARGPFSIGAYVNYVNDYSDNNLVPEQHVASWTTADISAAYEFLSGDSSLRGFSISFSVINVADRDPPYVANPYGYPISYDGANANALGRYVSLRLQKRW